MTDLLKRLDELEAKATRANWFVDRATPYGGDWIIAAPGPEWITGWSDEDKVRSEANHRFIAELRNAYPKLRAVVEAALSYRAAPDDPERIQALLDLQEALEALND